MLIRILFKFVFIRGKVCIFNEIDYGGWYGMKFFIVCFGGG